MSTVHEVVTEGNCKHSAGPADRFCIVQYNGTFPEFAITAYTTVTIIDHYRFRVGRIVRRHSDLCAGTKAESELEEKINVCIECSTEIVVSRAGSGFEVCIYRKSDL